MRNQKYRYYHLVLGLAVVLSLGVVGKAVADTSSSTNYSVTETQFGAGSSLNDCSTSYCAKTSAGDNAVGSGSSASYSANFGFNTSDVPLLEVIAEGGIQNVGVYVGSTATTTSVIKVRDYLSSGYIIQLTGSPPNQGTHTLAAMNSSCPCTSHQGAEQFGINLAANTAPVVGSAPTQIPSSGFSFGVATDDYNTPNLFKYNDGDIIAQSLSSSGETDYTMSMIINVSNTTPAGNYIGTFSAVVVPTY